MLARPEIGSREHVLLWLAGDHQEPYYEWSRWTHCPRALYAREHGLPEWDGVDTQLSDLAGEFPRTWAALHERASKAWSVSFG